MRWELEAGPDKGNRREGGQRDESLLWPFRPLSWVLEIPGATREESGVLGFPSRRGLTSGGSLECNPEIPAFPGESQGRGSLVGCCLWGRTESDTPEVT